MTIEESVLEHHGVKGMKWGVRNDRGHEGERASTRKIAKADKKFEKNYSPSVHNWVKVNNTFATHINPGLHDLNENPKYKGINLHESKELHDSYMNDYEKLVEHAANKTSESFGMNASGTRKVEVSRVGFGSDATWQARIVDVQHAASGDVLFTVVPTFNETGHIMGQKIKPPATLQQTAISAESVLEHHGVKGMKWGVRKDGDISSTTERTSHLRRPAKDVTVKQRPGKFVRTRGGQRQTASEEAVKVAATRQVAKKSTTDALSTKQLQEAVQRMNLENQYHTLLKKQDRRTRGQRFIQAIFHHTPSKETNTGVTEKAKQVASALAKTATAAAAAG